jgi:hypothetical protein
MNRRILFLSFIIGSTIITGLTSFKTKTASIEIPLANHHWTFQKAESQHGDTQYLLNNLYEKSSYYFSGTQQYQGKFFEKAVAGTWKVDGNKLILDEGASKEEEIQIVEISSKVLKLSVTEKGETVTLVYQ